MEIFIAPVKFHNSLLLQNLVNELSKRFSSGIQVIDLKLNLEDFFSPDRKQYFSTQIIAEAMKLTDKFNGKVIMLTDVDIFVPVLTFIFGEAQLNGKHSILSSAVYMKNFIPTSPTKIFYSNVQSKKHFTN